MTKAIKGQSIVEIKKAELLQLGITRGKEQGCGNVVCA